MPLANPRGALSREERWLIDLALHWRDAKRLGSSDGLDVDVALELVQRNRLAPFAAAALEQAPAGAIPPGMVDAISEGARRSEAFAQRCCELLTRYLRAADEHGPPTIPLKGVALSNDLYGDPGLRPGTDIDVLVDRQDVAAASDVLATMGFGRWWPNLLEDDFYLRHHLHVERCDPTWKLWFEIHWAFDHPLTAYTIDYRAVFERATTRRVFDAPALQLDPVDELCYLAIHFVKHAVYLPAAVQRDDLTRVLIADGLVVALLDIAEMLALAVDRGGWTDIEERAAQWGVKWGLGAVLATCRSVLGSEVPDGVIERTARTPRRAAARLMHAMADSTLDDRADAWTRLFSHKPGLGLRTARIVDALDYLLPDDETLARTYARTGPATRPLHLARALAGYSSLVISAARAHRARERRLVEQGLRAVAKRHIELGP